MNPERSHAPTNFLIVRHHPVDPHGRRYCPRLVFYANPRFAFNLGSIWVYDKRDIIGRSLATICSVVVLVPPWLDNVRYIGVGNAAIATTYYRRIRRIWCIICGFFSLPVASNFVPAITVRRTQWCVDIFHSLACHQSLKNYSGVEKNRDANRAHDE